MKTTRQALLLIASLMLPTAAIVAENVAIHWTSPVKQRYATFYAEPHGTPPEEMSYLIEPANPDPKFRDVWEAEAKTNHNLIPKNRAVSFEIFEDYKKAIWVPFKTNLLVDLGPGDGERWLRVGFRNKNDDRSRTDSRGNVASEENPNWAAHFIVVQSSPLNVVITSPKQGVTSQPTIQLTGYAPVPIVDLRYEVVDEHGNSAGRGGEGLITDQYYDPARAHYTTNSFECFDVNLSPGTNIIRFHCEDDAGNILNTNLIYVFTSVGDTNPPVFSVTWPRNATSCSGSQFDLYGKCDDPTAVITGLLTDDKGNSSHLNGFVERNGCLWIEEVPVADGKNHLTIVAADAAHNSSVTNLMFTKSSLILCMDKVADPNQLWQARITATGFCSDTNRVITVSGVKASMKPDGHWVATNVPVDSPNGGGTATFHITTDGDNDDSSLTNTWLPAVCSQPHEGNPLLAGLSVNAPSPNQYNHYSICLGLTNSSCTDIPNAWILPNFAARFALRLFDATGKELTKQEGLEKSGQVLATNLNIHHLGRDELANLDGIISFRTNSTTRVASINLDEHFQMPPPGIYRLEITLRMFQLAMDGQLIPYEFPSLATPIRIVGQPSETVFSLNDLHRQGKLTWGAEGHGLRVGVVHGMKWTQIHDANQIEVFLENNTTNDCRDGTLRLPASKEEFAISLYDSNGKEISKTALGKQQGQPLSLDGQTPGRSGGFVNTFFGNENNRRLKSVFVAPKDATECGRFILNDYFEIKSPGKYWLTYQERLYRLNTNSVFTAVVLPLANVPVDISYVPDP